MADGDETDVNEQGHAVQSGPELTPQNSTVRVIVVGLERATAVQGAGIWQMQSGQASAVLKGATDVAGEAEFDLLSGGLRVMAHGHIPVDILPRRRVIQVFPTRLHPGAYSGLCAGVDDAVWVPEQGGGPLFQFTAFGLMRHGSDFAALEGNGFYQYSLRQSMVWLPGPDPNPIRREWSGIVTRSYDFPANDRWGSSITHLNEFRFPEPARMIARQSSTKREVAYRLWN